MFNLTPSVYILEMQDKTAAEITNAVSSFINSTKI